MCKIACSRIKWPNQWSSVFDDCTQDCLVCEFVCFYVFGNLWPSHISHISSKETLVEGIYALIITTCKCPLYRKMLDMYALKSLDFALILILLLWNVCFIVQGNVYGKSFSTVYAFGCLICYLRICNLPKFHFLCTWSCAFLFCLRFSFNFGRWFTVWFCLYHLYILAWCWHGCLW